MTLMLLHYNLCSNLPYKEKLTGRWLMFQVTKHFKNICRFKIHLKHVALVLSLTAL